MAKVGISVVAVLLFITLVNGYRGWPYNSPCNIHTWGFQESDRKVTIPEGCMNGSVWWNYPQGILQVTWNHPHEFIVCLTPELGPHLSNISQLVDSRLITLDIVQEDGKEVCLPEPDTTVVAMLEQPPFLTYMTLYAFRVIYQ